MSGSVIERESPVSELNLVSIPNECGSLTAGGAILLDFEFWRWARGEWACEKEVLDLLGFFVVSVREPVLFGGMNPYVGKKVMISDVVPMRMGGDDGDGRGGE